MWEAETEVIKEDPKSRRWNSMNSDLKWRHSPMAISTGTTADFLFSLFEV